MGNILRNWICTVYLSLTYYNQPFRTREGLDILGMNCGLSCFLIRLNGSADKVKIVFYLIFLFLASLFVSSFFPGISFSLVFGCFTSPQKFCFVFLCNFLSLPHKCGYLYPKKKFCPFPTYTLSPILLFHSTLHQFSLLYQTLSCNS